MDKWKKNDFFFCFLKNMLSWNQLKKKKIWTFFFGKCDLMKESQFLSFRFWCNWQEGEENCCTSTREERIVAVVVVVEKNVALQFVAGNVVLWLAEKPNGGRPTFLPPFNFSAFIQVSSRTRRNVFKTPSKYFTFSCSLCVDICIRDLMERFVHFTISFTRFSKKEPIKKKYGEGVISQLIPSLQLQNCCCWLLLLNITKYF